MIYANFSCIKGSVTDEKYKNHWVEIDDVEFTGISSSFCNIHGKSGNRVNSKAQFGEINIIKQTDLSSIDLMQRSFTHEVISEVKIHYITTGKPNFTFMEFVLKDVLISHFSHQHSSSGGRPMERLHLNYTEIACHYHPLTSEPTNNGQVLRTSYNLHEAKKGVLHDVNQDST